MHYKDEPKTLVRGLAILEALSTADASGLKIAQIAAKTQISRPTVYRFVSVLLNNGYINEISDTGRYIYNRDKLNQIADFGAESEQFKGVLRKISEQTGDSSFLIRQDNADSLCIHREIGTYPLQVLSIQIDHKQPMGVGAAGLALLSYLPESEQERILAENEQKLYPYGAISVKKLRLLMKATRERGWSAVGNAAVQGVLGVGVAVADRGGCPRFAISVSSVEARFTVARQKAVVQIIKHEIAALDSYGCIK